MLAIEYVPYDGPIVTRAEAKAVGLVRYFNGIPCKRGHIAQRTTGNNTCIVCARGSSSASHKAHPPNQILARARRLRWSDANKEHPRNFYVANAEMVKARVKAWRAANRQTVYANVRNRNAKKRAAAGSHTAADIQMLFKAQRGRCAYCRVSIKSGHHVDHITALVKGGSNAVANLQLTCVRCNTSKSARDAIEFAQSMGLLI